MMKTSLKFLLVGFLVFALTGCTVRRYTQVRDRVDQEVSGNAGYLSGTPSAKETSSARKTRKTYVLEFSLQSPEEVQRLSSQQKEETPPPSYTPSYTPPPKREEPRPYIPRIEDVPAPEASTNPGEYTVEKGDTLQKISKKFYDTPRKWPQIYQANKEKIKDPNRLKEGTVIVIPK